MTTFQIIMVALVAGVFFYAWRKGHLLRLTNYVGETKVELRKCNWPTRDELKSSTVVVMVSIMLVGLFTVFVDFLVRGLINYLIK